MLKSAEKWMTGNVSVTSIKEEVSTLFSCNSDVSTEEMPYENGVLNV